MNQEIFTGVGNIIRNEALYRAAIHPHSLVGKIPAIKISKLITEVHAFARLFYKKLEKGTISDLFKVYQQTYAADGSEVTMKGIAEIKTKNLFQ